MTSAITAFERSPDRGRGLARDMRVRWALEEVGQPYDVRLVSFAAMKQPGSELESWGAPSQSRRPGGSPRGGSKPSNRATHHFARCRMRAGL